MFWNEKYFVFNSPTPVLPRNKICWQITMTDSTTLTKKKQETLRVLAWVRELLTWQMRYWIYIKNTSSIGLKTTLLTHLNPFYIC